MTTQPEALRLADALSAAIKQVDADDDVIHVARWFVEDADAELRRLSAENEALWKEREEPHQKIQMYLLECNRLENERDEARRTVREAHEAGTRLTAQRDALLEACRAMLAFIERHAPRGLQPEPGSPVAKARAAIKAVEGEKT